MRREPAATGRIPQWLLAAADAATGAAQPPGAYPFTYAADFVAAHADVFSAPPVVGEEVHRWLADRLEVVASGPTHTVVCLLLADRRLVELGAGMWPSE